MSPAECRLPLIRTAYLTRHEFCQSQVYQIKLFNDCYWCCVQQLFHTWDFLLYIIKYSQHTHTQTQPSCCKTTVCSLCYNVLSLLDEKFAFPSFPFTVMSAKLDLQRRGGPVCVCLCVSHTHRVSYYGCTQIRTGHHVSLCITCKCGLTAVYYIHLWSVWCVVFIQGVSQSCGFITQPVPSLYFDVCGLF